MTTSERMRDLYLQIDPLTENQQLEYFNMQLQFEKENDVELPMSSFINYDLKHKIRHRDKLSTLETLQLIEGFNKLNSLAGRISEECVQESKQDISSRKAVEEIRKILGELYG